MPCAPAGPRDGVCPGAFGIVADQLSPTFCNPHRERHDTCNLSDHRAITPHLTPCRVSSSARTLLRLSSSAQSPARGPHAAPPAVPPETLRRSPCTTLQTSL